MSITVKCPHCNNLFGIADDVAEEVLNPNIAITRRTTERASWSSIAEEINGGYAYRVISVGDEISFKLKNGEDCSIVAVHENPYWKNSMAFSFVNCIGEYYMNDTSTNRGGWYSSKMRCHMGEIIKLLPDELVAVIKDRTITQILNGTKYESVDKLWLQSRTEVFGYNESYRDIDFGDVHFDYYHNEKSRVKMLNNSSAYWWERSPFYDNSNGFCYVISTGNANDYGARYAFGVAPAFII